MKNPASLIAEAEDRAEETINLENHTSQTITAFKLPLGAVPVASWSRFWSDIGNVYTTAPYSRKEPMQSLRRRLPVSRLRVAIWRFFQYGP